MSPTRGVDLAAPVDGRGAAPVDGLVAAPVDGRVAAPVEGLVAAPVDGRVAAPVEGLVAAPVDGRAPVEAAGRDATLPELIWPGVFSERQFFDVFGVVPVVPGRVAVREVSPVRSRLTFRSRLESM